MKRVLSLVLVLVLVLGSVPMAFAAEESAGDMLKAAGFVAGDADGNLKEDDKLTREQMMVLIAEMNGVKEEAATFGIPADFSDVNENDWFAPYVWYAFYQGWTAGMGDGSFGAGVSVDSKMASTFMLKALGHEVADYNASVAQAADAGIKIEEAAELTRGEGFDAMWSTVNLPKMGSEVSLGVELGKLEAPAEEVAEVTAVLDAVAAIGNTVVEVTFDDDVEAAAAEAVDYVVVKRGTSTALEVKAAMAVASDRVLLETAAQTAGEAYTITVGETSINFTGLEKDSDKPEIDSIKGTDTDLVEVTFEEEVDYATATDIANFSIDKIGTVTAAELKDDHMTVKLTVEGFTKVQSGKMTVENVLSVDGVKMDKDTTTFYPRFDKKAPELEKVVQDGLNNVEVIVYFSDDNGVDEETAEDISNYSIEGLDILKAVADDREYDSTSSAADKGAATSDDMLRKVTLTTSEQKDGKKYIVKVLNMVDGSTAKNAMAKEDEDDFRGGDKDETEPKLKDITVLSLTQVAVEFTEDNLLDPASALDLSNYTVQKDALDILDAQFKDDDEEEYVIYLTVSEMDDNDNYKFYVNNVADEFGNAMDDEDAETIDSGDIVSDAATSIKTVTVDSSTQLTVEFNQAVTSDTMEDPTNYMVDESIGGALTAKATNDTKVVLTFNEMKGNETYKLTINGVETFSEYAMDDAKYSFIVPKDENDTEQPEVESVDNDDQGILKVEFSEEMMIAAGALVTFDDASTALAMTTTGSDDEVVIFTVLAKEQADTTSTDYKITSFTGVTDLAGNVPDYEANSEEFETDGSYDAGDFEFKYEDTNQTDVVTLEIEYDVDLAELSGSAGTVVLSGKKDDKAATATFTIDDVDGSVVTLKLLNASESPFDDEEDVTFKLNTTIGDLVDRAVYNETITVEWDADDDTKPEIVEVNAIDERIIEVVYDETIAEGSLGTYTVKDEDNKSISGLSVERVYANEDDDTIVMLRVTKDLDGDEYYTLKQVSEAKDVAGNKAEEIDDGIEFLGSSIKYEQNTINGVTIETSKKLKIKDNEALPEGTYTVTSGSAKLVEFTFDGAAIAVVSKADSGSTVAISSDFDTITFTLADDQYALTEKQDYTVKVVVSDIDSAGGIVNPADTATTFEDTFKGIVEVLDFVSAPAATDTTVEVDGLDEDEDYIVAVYVNGTKQVVYDDANSIDKQVEGTLTLNAALVSTDTVLVVVTDAASGVVTSMTKGATVN